MEVYKKEKQEFMFSCKECGQINRVQFLIDSDEFTEELLSDKDGALAVLSSLRKRYEKLQLLIKEKYNA